MSAANAKMSRRIVAVCITAVALAGCATLGYYAQAVTGQLGILARRRDVAAVVNDPATPPAVRAKLEYALKARDFASERLHLPDNASYRRYVKLDRRYPV